MVRGRGERGPRASSGTDGNPFTERGFIVSGALLGFLLVFALVTVFFSDDSSSARGDGTQSGAPYRASVPLNGVTPCPALPTADPATRDGMPDDVSWANYRGIFLPSSATAGPVATDGELAHCFARTRAGAVMAAVQISARYFVAPDWRAVAEHQFVPGEDRDAAVRVRAEDEATSSPRTADPNPDAVRQVAGYRIVSFTPDAAMVWVAMDIRQSGSPTGTLYSLTWVDGDWRVNPQPNGNASTADERLTSIVGYTPWGVGAVGS